MGGDQSQQRIQFTLKGANPGLQGGVIGAFGIAVTRKKNPPHSRTTNRKHRGGGALRDSTHAVCYLAPQKKKTGCSVVPLPNFASGIRGDSPKFPPAISDCRKKNTVTRSARRHKKTAYARWVPRGTLQRKIFLPEAALSSNDYHARDSGVDRRALTTRS